MSEVTKIFIGNLPIGTKPAELKHIFEGFGIVVECDVMNRCGFVHMGTFDMADSAISALNGTEFRGQQIVVEAGKPKERGMGGVARGGRAAAMAAIRGTSRGGGGNMQGRGGGMIEGSGAGVGSRGRGGMTPRGGVNRGGNMRGGNFNARDGGNCSSNNGPGPMRSPNFKKSRNMPYMRGGQMGPTGDDDGQFGNSSPPLSTKFGGDNRGGIFNNISQGLGNYGNQGQDFGNNFNNFNDTEDFQSNNSNFSGGYNNSRGGKFGGGRSGNFSGPPGQDRRGFALPPQQEQPPPHFVTDMPNSQIEEISPYQRGGNNAANMDVGGMHGGSGRGGFGGRRGSGRGNFGSHRGNFNNDRGGFNSPRSGFNESRGGFNDSRSGFNDSRGGLQESREGFNESRGGFNDSRGGYNDSRGNFRGSRGRFSASGRGGFGGQGTDQGSFEGGRGSFGNGRGGGGFKRGGGPATFDTQNNYQTEFPPLRGGGNNFRGGRGSGTSHMSRQNLMTNRRFE